MTAAASKFNPVVVGIMFLKGFSKRTKKKNQHSHQPFHKTYRRIWDIFIHHLFEGGFILWQKILWYTVKLQTWTLDAAGF